MSMRTKDVFGGLFRGKGWSNLMDIGSTSGRGFESALALYVWAAVIVIALLLWAWFHYDIRKGGREEDAEEEPDD